MPGERFRQRPVRSDKKTGLIVGVLVAFFVGNVTGFVLGVYSTKAGKEFIDDLVTTEAPADIVNHKEISRAGFSLKYPGNWKMDTTDEEYDADHSFSIDSPGDCFTMFIIFDIDTAPSENVEAQIESFVPSLLKNPARTPFTKWGRYAGHGVDLKGRLLGINKGSVRVFSHSSESRSFVVIELYYDEDHANVQPGFRLIENSFRLVR